MSEPDSDDLSGSPDDKILKEAKKRFKKCEAWESDTRKLFVDDLKFANGDSDNNYQWPGDILKNRDIGKQVSLTINMVRQHNLQIMNDARQNKPGVTIRPVGGGASYEAAEVFEGLVRHIEYVSNAQAAYDTATRFQVQAGYGAWRIVTDYLPDSFDQEIYIRRIKDPLSVYIDPDITEVDGSDARFAFVFDDMPKDEFDNQHPEFKDIGGEVALGNSEGWIDKDHVRRAEYYRRTEKKDRLVGMTDPVSGEQSEVRASEVPANILKLVMEDPTTKVRDIIDQNVEWFLIVGNEIVDRKDWAGIYIPVCRVVGEETVIDGNLDRKGHTRAMKDAQKMYNFWTSSAAQQVALQTKTPWTGPMKAFEGLTNYWDTANTVDYAWLPWNHVDDAGQPIPEPKRTQPPQMAAGYIEGLKLSAEDLRAVSGQWQAEMGMPGNERSGKAINARQRQGENATYHYIDHLAIAVRFTGRILLDLIPKIYDTARVVRILAEDGDEKQVHLDPKAKQAFLEQKGKNEEAAKAIFNPNVGKYDVMSDVGPSYATQRQEAFNAFTQLIASNKELTLIAGDLMFKAADFPGADVIAERLERMVPAQAKGDEPPPELMHARQQLQATNSALEKMAEVLADEKLKLKKRDAEEGDRTAQKAIDEYEAITGRLKVLLPTIINPADIARMVHDLGMQEHASNRTMLETTHGAILDNEMPQEGDATQPAPQAQQPDQSQGMEQPGEAAPFPGARKAPDGQWYVQDPRRPGKYLMAA